MNNDKNIFVHPTVKKLLAKGPGMNKMDALKILMIRDGLSVSEAIRKLTNLIGLPKGF